MKKLLRTLLAVAVVAAAFSSTPAAASTDAVYGDRIYMIGDSLTAANPAAFREELAKVGFTNPVTHAYGGRAIRTHLRADRYTGLEAVDNLRATQGDTGLWIVALGTNDAYMDLAQFAPAIREMMNRIGPGRRVMWVNVYHPRWPNRQNAWNAALLQVAAERPGEMFVYDWASVAAANPGWMTSDRIHYTSTGTRQRAIRVAAAARELIGYTYRVSGFPAPAVAATGGAGRLVTTAPTRDLDTRLTGNRFAAGETREVSLPSVPNGSTAAVLNVTVDDPQAPGFLTLFPCGGSRPIASTVNYVPGRAVAAGTIMPTGSAKTVCIYSHAAADVILDVSGGFVPGSATGLVPTSGRLLDTRTSGPVPAGGVTRFQVDGTAAMFTLTVTEPTAAGFLTAYPCGGAVPVVSNLNYVAGETRANLVIVPANASGEVCIASHSQAHVIVDVRGVFTHGGLAFQPSLPTRILDTRNGIGGWRGPMKGGQRIDVAMPSAAVVYGTVIAVDTTSAGFLNIDGTGQRPPQMSVVNFPSRATVAAPFASQVSEGTGKIVAHGLPLAGHVVVDITGWFA